MVVVIESSTLIAEVERYLGVVEYFRAHGCEPRWSAELAPAAAEPVEPATTRPAFAGPG